MSTLETANDHVISELEDLGFYDSYMSKTEVYLVLASGAYGYQWYGGDGSICIPRVSFSHLSDLYHGIFTSLTDVLRHEYGHAIADTHRGLMRSKRFSEAFGASHSLDDGAWEYDPEHHVTDYAATNTGEDFAEVFWLYVKHKGSLPEKYNSAPIRRKWGFVEDLRGAIKAGERRW